MRILIVEDEAVIRRGLANLINNHTEHSVIGEAKNGREGLLMIRECQPDLVITDIRMPKMDGLSMIRECHGKEGAPRYVILSGYSEFEYAKQALRFGVDDYLIKPLAPEDVTKLLNQVKERIEAELVKQLGTPQKRLKELLLEKEEGAFEDFKALCHFEDTFGYCLLGAYMGAANQTQREECRRRFEKINARREGSGMVFVFLENTREFFCLMENRDFSDICREVENRLIRPQLSEKGWIFAKTSFASLGELPEACRRLRGLYPYEMVFGAQQVISEALLDSFCPQEYRYPQYLEKDLQTALYGGSGEAVRGAGGHFTETMRELKSRPEQIREGYMKMTSFLLALLEENNKQGYLKLQELNLMNRIGLAVTSKELQEPFLEAVRIAAAGIGQREDISNYTIRRALAYIRSHYQEGISLEVVAGSLDITPEYLSTLFNREMGQNFSVFLKRFRLSHAKRLLKGTDKKIYEIAREVGYGDPKYFNRVFKEEEGLSPGEFRALHS